MIKKLILVAALISASMAQAVEVGVTDGNNFSKQENVWGVTVGTQVRGLGVTGGFARNASSDTYSVLGAKDVTNFGPATVELKAGLAFVVNTAGSDWNSAGVWSGGCVCA